MQGTKIRGRGRGRVAEKYKVVRLPVQGDVCCGKYYVQLCSNAAVKACAKRAGMRKDMTPHEHDYEYPNEGIFIPFLVKKHTASAAI